MEKPSFESCFRLNAILLKLSGLLLPESAWLRSVNWMLVGLAVFSPLFLVLPAIYGATYHWREIGRDERTDMISVNEEVLFALFKGIQAIRTCPRFTGALCVIMPSFIVMPFFDKFLYDSNGTVIQSKHLLCSAGLVHQNEVIYNVWYAIQVPLSLLSVSGMLGIDVAVAVFILHAAAHMKLVGFRLGSIAKSDNADETVGNQLETRRKLHECIFYHQEVQLYCQELEDVFSLVLLFATLLGMTVIAVDGFNIFTEISASFKYIVHLIGALLQLLVFCWPAQTLINESIGVSEAAYALPWTSWPLEDRKSVCILLMRAQTPATVTAGKFTVVSILTFSEIVAKAVSFFTVLRTTV